MSSESQCPPILVVITGHIFQSRWLSGDHAAAVHNGKILYDTYDKRLTEGLPEPYKCPTVIRANILVTESD